MSGERLFLMTKDFSLKGKILGLKYTGFCLNLFYSNECQYCGPFYKILQQLPELVSGCAFGFTNIDKNPKLPTMSGNTTTRIEHVPFIVFYAKGIPIAVYEGPPDLESMKRFVVMEANNSQQKITQQNFQPKREKPAYCLGNPKQCDRDNKKCYTSISQAYKQ